MVQADGFIVGRMVAGIEPKVAHINREDIVFSQLIDENFSLDHGIRQKNELHQRMWKAFDRIEQYAFQQCIITFYVITCPSFMETEVHRGP